MTEYRYEVLGQCVASNVEFPELGGKRENSILSSDRLDLRISLEQDNVKPPESSRIVRTMSRHRYMVQIPGAGTIIVTNGNRISIKLEERCAFGDLRSHVLTTGLGVTLHQRHWFPLHASAIRAPSGLWVFIGHAGAGKSTLAGALHRATGWPIVSDDVLAINPLDADSVAHSGITRLKLWKDAALHLGENTDELQRDLSKVDKYHATKSFLFDHTPSPIAGIVTLKRLPVASLSQLNHAEAFQEFMNSILGAHLVPVCNDVVLLSHLAARVVQRSRAYKFSRPWDLEHEGKTTTLLVRTMQNGGP